MSSKKDKKYLRKLKKSQYLSPELKSTYVEQLEKEIEERQLKREENTKSELRGLLWEKEMLNIFLANLKSE